MDSSSPSTSASCSSDRSDARNGEGLAVDEIIRMKEKRRRLLDNYRNEQEDSLLPLMREADDITRKRKKKSKSQFQAENNTPLRRSERIMTQALNGNRTLESPVDQPQLVPDAVSEPQHEPEFEPEPAPISEPQHEPEFGPEPAPISEPQHEPEFGPEPAPISEPQHEPEFEPEPAPREEAEPEPAPREEAEPEPAPIDEYEPEPAPMDESEPEPEPTDESELEVYESEPEPAPMDESEPESASMDESEPEPPSMDESEPEPPSMDESEPEPASMDESEPEPASMDESEPEPASMDESEPEPASMDESEPEPASMDESEPEPEPTDESESEVYESEPEPVPVDESESEVDESEPEPAPSDDSESETDEPEPGPARSDDSESETSYSEDSDSELEPWDGLEQDPPRRGRVVRRAASPRRGFQVWLGVRYFFDVHLASRCVFAVNPLPRHVLQPLIMPRWRVDPDDNWYGERRGFNIGYRWNTRLECSHDRVHRPSIAGIHPGPHGAYSVALSGVYPDDVDYGNVVIFTGAGGRDLRSASGKPRNVRNAPQVRDQELNKANWSLIKSVNTGNPVRLIRGYRLASSYAPDRGYRYDGLYRVVRFWYTRGFSGFHVFRFKMFRLANQTAPPWETERRFMVPRGIPAPPARDALIRELRELNENIEERINRLAENIRNAREAAAQAQDEDEDLENGFRGFRGFPPV